MSLNVRKVKEQRVTNMNIVHVVHTANIDSKLHPLGVAYLKKELDNV